jgi:predicted TIM-barrel fold metal-dependent hydrolase
MNSSQTDEASQIAFLADKPFVNCHTHIFTGEHVPPFLARSYLPFPFYVLFPVNLIVAFFRFYFRFSSIIYGSFIKRLVRVRTIIAQILIWLGLVATAAGYWLTALVIVYANHLIAYTSPKLQLSGIVSLQTWMENFHIYIYFSRLWMELLVVLLSCLAFPSVRNMFIAVARISWKFVASLPGKNTIELINRYLTIGRYAFHKRQRESLAQLARQYPKHTRIVVLPMDMEFMSAGNPRKRYRDQMQELAELKESKPCKDILLPFIFIDPRRCVPLDEEKNSKPGDKIFFSYKWDGSKIVLGDCFINDFINEHKFIGFKIYPALGYYPFDPVLLPLWKYAEENDIPILSHCIRGTIFYRGAKKWSWNKHPVFEQSMARNEGDEGQAAFALLDLPQMKNVDFSYNFTHPMNFLCLLEESLLRKLIHAEVKKDPNSDLKNIFGYSDETTPLLRHLRNLKICLAHFGGDDEWKKYYERDRYFLSNELMQDPVKGLDFFTNKSTGEPRRGKPEQIWKYVDWYTIICSMILQYPNVYADISYILHDTQAIQPLLKQTLENKGLRPKVLYGTDFFVVRNHKSDKNMLAEYEEGLSHSDFTVIAKKNPRTFLYNKIHGALFKEEQEN